MTNEQDNEIVATIELKLTRKAHEFLRNNVALSMLGDADGPLVKAWKKVINSIEKGEESITLHPRHKNNH